MFHKFKHCFENCLFIHNMILQNQRSAAAIKINGMHTLYIPFSGGEVEIRTLEAFYGLRDFQSRALDQLGDFSELNFNANQVN